MGARIIRESLQIPQAPVPFPALIAVTIITTAADVWVVGFYFDWHKTSAWSSEKPALMYAV